jgi:hypothetical protein
MQLRDFPGTKQHPAVAERFLRADGLPAVAPTRCGRPSPTGAGKLIPGAIDSKLRTRYSKA